MTAKEDPLERLEKAMRAQAGETGYPSLEIHRTDGFMLAKSNVTAEQYAAWRRDAAAYREALPGAMLARVERLEKLILQFDPLDTIAHIAWINALHDAEHWDEHQFEGNDAYTEYIALLCLTHQYGDFEHPTIKGSLQLDGQAIQDEIRHLFQLSAQEDQLEPLNAETSPSPAEELRFMTLLHEVGVRYPGSNSHLHEVLGEMLDPLSTEMAKRLGFSIRDALALDSSISAHLNEKLLHRMKQASEFEASLRKAVKRYRQKRRLDDRFDKELIKNLATMRPSEAAEQARRVAITWLYFAFGHTMSFTSAELAQAADVGEAEARAFLDSHSLEFGAVDRFFRLPRPTHPLQSRPIIRLADEEGTRYFCPVWQAVSWALRPRLEEELTEDPGSGPLSCIAALYETRRSDYCERKAFELLTALLKPADGDAHMSAKYRREIEGEQREFEIDGTILLGHVLVLLEVKSGGV